MKAKLTIDGKELEVEISEEELKKLQTKSVNKTGYERVENGQKYYYALDCGDVDNIVESGYNDDDDSYEGANYYSDESVAINNSRADKLIRQLRRFSVEHRNKELDWNDGNQNKYYIEFDHDENKFTVDSYGCFHGFGTIYFASNSIALLAIDTFRSELEWYFTEYKDSL